MGTGGKADRCSRLLWEHIVLLFGKEVMKAGRYGNCQIWAVLFFFSLAGPLFVKEFCFG